ncbi:hypothetical protein EYD10_08776, partial [Varanus komodoensis]
MMQPSLDIKPFVSFSVDGSSAVGLFPNFNTVCTHQYSVERMDSPSKRVSYTAAFPSSSFSSIELNVTNLSWIVEKWFNALHTRTLNKTIQLKTVPKILQKQFARFSSSKADLNFLLKWNMLACVVW